jgi:hypothetical protein
MHLKPIIKSWQTAFGAGVPLIDPDLRIADRGANLFQRPDHIFGPVAEPRVERERPVSGFC